MSEPILQALAGGSGLFRGDGTQATLERLLPTAGAWEIEIGFGKGRFLLSSAAAHPERRFLGIEVAGEYFRLAAGRMARRRLTNVVLLRGDALALLAARLPRGFATVVHVYFPDPWPKKRHLKRRLLSPASLDLILGALQPGGRLDFATDFLAYGHEVEALFSRHPGVRVERLSGGWPEGPRTNYEAKYVAEGRPVLRLSVTTPEGEVGLHPGVDRELAVAASVVAAGV